jgi:competence protein ComGC
MPKSQLHEIKKSKNYTLLTVILVIIILSLIMTVVKMQTSKEYHDNKAAITKTSK